MADSSQTQTVYVVVHGMSEGQAYMHDDMIKGVFTDESAVEGIPEATSIPLGSPVDEIYYEAELNP